MIAELIKNILNDTEYSKLMLKKNSIVFVDCYPNRYPTIAHLVPSHKHFSKTVATVDPLPVALFTVTSLDLSNVEKYKKLFYSRVDSQVVAELINNIFTDDEYSKLMLKIIFYFSG